MRPSTVRLPSGELVNLEYKHWPWAAVQEGQPMTLDDFIATIPSKAADYAREYRAEQVMRGKRKLPDEADEAKWNDSFAAFLRREEHDDEEG